MNAFLRILALAVATPLPALWQPEPLPTPPPPTSADLDYVERSFQVRAQNLVFGLLQPYCDAYDGFVSANPSQGANPYPVIVTCRAHTLRVDAPTKITVMP